MDTSINKEITLKDLIIEYLVEEIKKQKREKDN